MFRTIDMRVYLFGAVVILSLAFSQANSQTNRTSKSHRLNKPISTQQRLAIEKIVREYLLKNPVVLREAMAALEVNETQEKLQRVALNLKAHKSDLYSDPTSPVAGNPDGDVTIVVFSTTLRTEWMYATSFAIAY